MQADPSRRFSDAELALFAKQAGERARLAALQANEQIEAKILDRPLLSVEEIDAVEAAAVEAAELQARQSNDRYDLAQTHRAQTQRLAIAKVPPQ